MNVRIIAAINKKLAAECDAGNFRWDPYYRMAVTELWVPSLVSRQPEEIDKLFEYFPDEIHKRHPDKHRLKANSNVINILRNKIKK